jgi:PAS domain-containing protein
MLDSLDVQVAALDARGTVIDANRAWVQFVRSTDADHGRVGTNYVTSCLQRADGASDLREVAAALNDMLAGDLDAYATQYRADAEGEERWLALRATPYGGAGRARIVIQREDVSARVRAEREATVRTRLLDDIDAAVIATDLDSTVTHWSRGAGELYGWSQAEAIGRSVNDLRSSWTACSRAARAGVSVRCAARTAAISSGTSRVRCTTTRTASRPASSASRSTSARTSSASASCATRATTCAR